MNARQIHVHLLRCYRLGVLSYVRLILAKTFSTQNEIGIGISGLREKVFLRKHTSDQSAFDQIFTEQSYEQPFLEGFSPKVIIDAGANVGYSTVYFANKYPDSVIIAIEPERSNFALLKKNTASYPNIHCVHAALWNQKTDLEILNNPTGRQWSFQVGEVSGGNGVANEFIPAVTIPGIMKKFGFGSIDILKLDIEGAEKELFSEHYEAWIPKCKVIIIELHERFAPGCSKAFYSALSNLFFRQYVKRENLFVDLRDNQEAASKFILP